MINIWKFQERLTGMLLGWAMASLVGGLALTRRNGDLAKGAGEQFAGWGIVNALIAIFGASAAFRHSRSPAMNTPVARANEARKLARILWINTGLDVFYVLGGILSARGRGATDDRWRGRGWGIVVQGGFLFFFDLIHALLLDRAAGRRPVVS